VIVLRLGGQKKV